MHIKAFGIFAGFDFVCINPLNYGISLFPDRS